MQPTCYTDGQVSSGCGVAVVSKWALHAAQVTGIKVLVTVRIQNRNDVPRQFGLCLKWIFQAYMYKLKPVTQLFGNDRQGITH